MVTIQAMGIARKRKLKSIKLKSMQRNQREMFRNSMREVDVSPLSQPRDQLDIPETKT